MTRQLALTFALALATRLFAQTQPATNAAAEDPVDAAAENAIRVQHRNALNANANSNPEYPAWLSRYPIPVDDAPNTPVAARGPAAAPALPSFKFALGSIMNPAGVTVVSMDTPYSPGKFGFDFNTKPTAYKGDAPGVSSATPFAFSVNVPEGNYKVTATVGGPQESTTTVLAESRRLMHEKIHTDAGKSQTLSFIVNVRNAKVPPPPTNAPGGSEVRTNSLDNPISWDDKLTLAFTGTNPAVQSITIEPAPQNIPTIFIMGDSTVTDQPGNPGASWGQMLPAFFKDTVAIANHATSGETMKSSITGLRLDKVLSQIKRGDYLLVQFGHNDEKQNWPQTYVEPETTFKAYIGVFITEARRRGATPVLISPMERRTGTTPTANSHAGFPAAYAEIAKEQNVAFIDNWTSSKVMYAAMGDDLAAAFNDQTHHKVYGAYEIAKLVATGIRANKLPLAAELRPDFKDFDPAHPDKAANFTTPFDIRLNGRPPQRD